jgi:hypothetical protein
MATGKAQKPANGSALDFEAQLWTAAQAVPAPNLWQDLHPGLKAEIMPVRKDLAKPPFTDSKAFRKHDDVRWQFDEVTRKNSNPWKLHNNIQS